MNDTEKNTLVNELIESYKIAYGDQPFRSAETKSSVDGIDIYSKHRQEHNND